MTSRLILLLGLVCFLIACGGSATAPAAHPSLTGVYALVSVDGRALPIRNGQSDTLSGDLTVLAGDSVRSTLMSVTKDPTGGPALGTINLDIYMLTQVSDTQVLLRSTTSGRVDVATVSADTISHLYASGTPRAQLRRYIRSSP
ncbi:MAG TPA: hypothetical protein VF929_01895 [Gemmatimonadaceae bacterium]